MSVPSTTSSRPVAILVEAYPYPPDSFTRQIQRDTIRTLYSIKTIQARTVQEMKEGVQEIARTSKVAFLILFGHGGRNGIRFGKKYLSDTCRENPFGVSRVPIILASCSQENGLSKALSQLTQASVIATPGYLYDSYFFIFAQGPDLRFVATTPDLNSNEFLEIRFSEEEPVHAPQMSQQELLTRACQANYPSALVRLGLDEESLYTRLIRQIPESQFPPERLGYFYAELSQVCETDYPNLAHQFHLHSTQTINPLAILHQMLKSFNSNRPVLENLIIYRFEEEFLEKISADWVGSNLPKGVVPFFIEAVRMKIALEKNPKDPCPPGLEAMLKIVLASKNPKLHFQMAEIYRIALKNQDLCDVFMTSYRLATEMAQEAAPDSAAASPP